MVLHGMYKNRWNWKGMLLWAYTAITGHQWHSGHQGHRRNHWHQRNSRHQRQFLCTLLSKFLNPPLALSHTAHDKYSLTCLMYVLLLYCVDKALVHGRLKHLSIAMMIIMVGNLPRQSSHMAGQWLLCLAVWSLIQSYGYYQATVLYRLGWLLVVTIK